MNDKYMFIWNKSNVWRIDLDTQDMDKLGITIHEDAVSQIKRVRCGSNPDRVQIRVTQS